MKKARENRSKHINFAKLKDTYQDQQLLISIGKCLTAEKNQDKLLERFSLSSRSQW